jgi:hypothetical protein
MAPGERLVMLLEMTRNWLLDTDTATYDMADCTMIESGYSLVLCCAVLCCDAVLTAKMLK